MREENESRPQQERPESIGGDTPTLGQRAPKQRQAIDEIRLANFAAGILSRAYLEALPDYWSRRADDARNAYPRPGDALGTNRRQRAHQTIRSMHRVFQYDCRRIEATKPENVDGADWARHSSFRLFACFELAELRDNPIRRRDPARRNLQWSREELQHLDLVHDLIVHGRYLVSVA